MRPLYVTLAVAPADATMSASAQDCEWSTSSPEHTRSEGSRTYDFDNDMCQPERIFSWWVYEVSNHIPGLQRGDEVDDDTCGGEIESDTILY